MPLPIPKPLYCRPGFNMTPALDPSCASNRCRASASGCCSGAPCCPCCCRHKQSHAQLRSHDSVHANLLEMRGLQQLETRLNWLVSRQRQQCVNSLQFAWKVLEWIALLDVTASYSTTPQQDCSEFTCNPQCLKASNFCRNSALSISSTQYVAPTGHCFLSQHHNLLPSSVGNKQVSYTPACAAAVASVGEGSAETAAV